MTESEIIISFHHLWRERCLNDQLTFLGVKACKSPMDLWVYQEIIYDVRPRLIIECGTYQGGSALFFATMQALNNVEGLVISIDANPREPLPEHSHLVFVRGDSLTSGFAVAAEYRARFDSCLVILDSDHHKDHVLKELELYSPLVSLGSYIIVEDSDLNGHPVGDLPYWNLGTDGPYEAVEEFLQIHDNFRIDERREKFLITVCRRGFLQRVQ